MAPHLNMINAENYIKEFKTYEEVMEYWFILRRDLYIQRIARQRILLRLEILYWENVLRFIYMDAHKIINIDKDLEAEDRQKILETAPDVPLSVLRLKEITSAQIPKAQHEFIKFNKTNLLHPKYLKADELENAILGSGASYDYIDDIRIGDKSKKNIAKLEKEIEDLKAKLEHLMETTWQDIWSAELKALEKVVEEGIATKWLFGETQHNFKNGAEIDGANPIKGSKKGKAKDPKLKPKTNSKKAKATN